jgi:glc operon protein GlcG
LIAADHPSRSTQFKDNAMKTYTILIVTVIGLFLSSSARAQLADKKTLTLEAAHKVLAAAIAEAKKDASATGVIAIVDDGGNTILLERLDGTFAAGANVSVGKARTAALFKKPTKFFEELINKSRTAMTALNDFTPLQGGVPIVVDNQIVGAIGVSGAASATRDNDIAEAGAAAFSATASAPQPPVSYFQHESVADAFAKGSILFQSPLANYAVHASRRDQGGQVEIHTHETDVIYVLDGEATFVTGGKIIDGKTTEPDQIRGRDIDGGETRHITRGDVIIVPAGVPHWFKEVPGTLQYYVVKVIG